MATGESLFQFEARREIETQVPKRMADSRAKNKWPAYRLIGLSSLALTVVGFVGLWLLKQIREDQEISELEFMQTALGRAAVWAFAACFLVGLMVLFPIALYLQGRAGVPIAGPVLPKWIAWPVQAIVVIIIGMMLVLWIAGLATLLFNR